MTDYQPNPKTSLSIARAGRSLEALHVVFCGPCRNRQEESQSEATAQLWRHSPITCWCTGHSEIATARSALGAAVSTGMPSDTDVVVMVDADVRPDPHTLMGLIGRAAYDPHAPVVVSSYPIRVPPGKEGSDDRLAHYVHDRRVWGGLGCVAMAAERFLQLHLLGAYEEHSLDLRQPLVRVTPDGPLSSAPYRVGVYDGRWLSEDLYFFRHVHRNGVPTVLYPRCSPHGAVKATARFKMLDGSPLAPELLLDDG